MGKKSRWSIDQILRIVAEAEAPGNSTTVVVGMYGFRSRRFTGGGSRQYRGFSVSETKRLKVLEEKNTRRKRLLAVKELEIRVLKVSKE